MAVYAYKAISPAQSPLRGTIAADSPRQARDLLRERGLTVVQLALQKASSTAGKWPALRLRRTSKAAVVSFLREISTLLSVGVPMLEAIDTILKQHHGHFHTVLLMLREQVSSGSSLAQAMRQHPDMFDELSISVTEVGQDSGTLDTSLQRLADFKERSLQLKNRVATALFYPVMVLVMGLLVSVFLMTFVVPNLLATLLEAGRELPLATRVVQAVSDTLIHGWWLIGLAALGLVLLIQAVARSEKGRWWWHRTVLRLPVVGPMVRKQAISRVALTVSTLIDSGVVFERALQIARDSTRNLLLKEALDGCCQAIRNGQEIAAALENTGSFPPLVVRVFAAGQQSGQLGQMLERLHRDYDQQVSVSAQRLTTILEPVLILILAVVVGFIAFATMLPILEAGDVL